MPSSALENPHPNNSEGEAGIVTAPGHGPAGDYTDPWRELFQIRTDTNNDGTLTHPDPTAKPATPPTPVIVFSSCPDRNPTTWGDNIIVP